MLGLINRAVLYSPLILGRSRCCRSFGLFQRLNSTLTTLSRSVSPSIPPKVATHLPAGPLQVWSRDIVIFSKNKGKRKTVKAVAKRFKRIGSGALKYWRPGKNHKMIVKSGRARRNLRKPRYANKTQLKTLNKMLSGI